MSLADPVFHTGGHGCVAVGEGNDERHRREASPAVADVFEDQFLKGDTVGYAFEREGLNDEFVHADLVKAAPEPVLLVADDMEIA